ncbi:MAG: hypothetical protein EOQ69_22525 [Mesorhizobium sp.]|nr:MAG: hypothetical protein EOQ69_22525 [Mesorhizobium sp.]
MTGFAQSFARDNSLYAHNFGLPDPAAMAFGVSIALPQAVLIDLGINPTTAYVIIVAAWLAVGYWSAYQFARWLGAGRPASVMSALVWCTLPVIWVHQDYSAAASGMVILPLTMLFAFRIIHGDTRLVTCASFVGACWIAVFMDGYTFMMLAVASALALVLEGIHDRKDWHQIIPRLLAIGLGLGTAYVAYALYEGRADFGGYPIEFFRAYGANIEFFFTPTKGLMSLTDLIGWGKDRAASMYFGDPSVYQATFAGALIGVALFAFATGRAKPEHRTLLALIALFAFWMALGPTVKLFTHRPPGLDNMMPDGYGWFPTGNNWLMNLPGFQSMRASYRWSALALFGCWALVVSMVASGRLSIRARAGLLIALFAFNIPSPTQFASYKASKDSVDAMMAEMSSWRSDFHSGEMVAFLPYGNDFLANVAANELDIRTYNIGGDKNQLMAQRSWPDEMSAFQFGQQGPDFAKNVQALLESGKVDAVVFPYVDMLWAPHYWPVPDDQKDNLEPIARQIDALPGYDGVYSQHYAVLRKR